MRTVSARKLRQVLRALGFREASVGDSSGHDRWVDRLNRSCRPVLRKKEVDWSTAYSLGLELEAKGVCNRRDFLKTLRVA